MTTAITGYSSELKVQIWAMEQGIDVALPPSCTNYVWDLLLYLDGGWKTVQVKTVRYYAKDACMRSELRRNNDSSYSISDCDYFVLCDIATNDLYMFKAKELENPNNPGFIIRDFKVRTVPTAVEAMNKLDWFKDHKIT